MKKGILIGRDGIHLIFSIWSQGQEARELETVLDYIVQGQFNEILPQKQTKLP